MSDHDHIIEPHTSSLHTRREFMRTSMLGAAVSLSIPVFLQKTFFTLDAMAADSAIQTANGKDGPILVILQLAGGNDGLNTVIPYADDIYYKSRPVIGVARNTVLPLSDYVGLHPKLVGLKGLFDEGHLSVMQGVGYPNPNRSHFRSTEIWQTASDSEQVAQYGWLGRYFDSCCKGADPTVGVAIGNETPQSFAASQPTGVSFSRPEQYRWVNGDRTGVSEQIYKEMNSPELTDMRALDENDGGSIDTLPRGTTAQPRRHGDSNLEFLQRTALDAQMSSDKILQVAQKFPASVAYPRSALGDSLSLVGRMIAGGLATRVYYVSHGGYDTHTNEVATHTRLMGELNDGLTAFAQDMKAQGNFNRVMLMTFSEFGRRVAQNASNGTDHGAAAPMFVIGGGIKPGLFGKYPSLQTLNAGDLAHNLDFRSVYATILDKWLRAPSKEVLGRQFPLVGIV
jgi:uncharacterized protein (DUF1501 family)